MRQGAAALPRASFPRTDLGRFFFRPVVREWSAGIGLGVMLATRGAPTFAMLANPVQERSFKTDVVAEAFRLQPFVLQDLFAFGEKFLIQTGLFHELAGRRRLLSWVSHEARSK